jgi:hypothetical protein
MDQFSKHHAAVVPTDITVIEDPAMVTQDEDGNALAGYKFVDRYTVRAHPLIIEALLVDEETEQVWTMDQILSSLE